MQKDEKAVGVSFFLHFVTKVCYPFSGLKVNRKKDNKMERKE